MTPRRPLALLLALCLLFSLSAAGCAESGQGSDSASTEILCTTFPHYDWTRRIVGDNPNVTVSLLIANGTDPHSYEPTVADLAALAHADAVVLVGGESDRWIREAIAVSGRPELQCLSLSQIDGITLREVTAESGHEHHAHDGHEEHAHGDFDEHLWLSLSNAMICVEALNGLVSRLDPEGAEGYRANTDRYLDELSALHLAFQQTVEASPRRELLFADRFPFVYLTEDYGLHVHAAFSGCTTDVDAGFETIIRLAESVRQMGVTRLMVTDGSNRELAEAVRRACSQGEPEILELDSMQTITSARIAAGETYLSVMEQNLAVLRTALS